MLVKNSRLRVQVLPVQEAILLRLPLMHRTRIRTRMILVGLVVLYRLLRLHALHRHLLHLHRSVLHLGKEVDPVDEGYHSN